MMMLRKAGMMMHPAVVGPTDPYFSSVSLLLHADGANGSTTITDSSSFANTMAVHGSTCISTTYQQWGSGCILFHGAGSTDYLDVPNQAFGTGDFTIEFYIRYITMSYPVIVDNRLPYPVTTNPAADLVLYFPSTSILTYYAGVEPSGGANRISGESMSTGPTYHTALCRASGTTRLFFDGVQYGVSYADTNNYNQTVLRLGANCLGTGNLNGWMDEVRITKMARYTSNFTLPMAQFPDA